MKLIAFVAGVVFGAYLARSEYMHLAWDLLDVPPRRLGNSAH